MNCAACGKANEIGVPRCGGCGAELAGGGGVQMVALRSIDFALASAPPAAASARSIDLSGTVLNGRYQMIARIGEGAFGAVYRAEQLQVGRQCAVKVLHADKAQLPAVIGRFRREAKAAAALKDSHTVQIYDFDATPDGDLFLAMELVGGRSLLDVLRDEKQVAWARVVHILDGVAQSLGEAHALGIIHRDIKLENIVLDRRGADSDYAKVLDFGTVKLASGSSLEGGVRITADGQTIGTVEYMSPEQLRGKELDGRADLYSLGVVAYALLCGTLPFGAYQGNALSTAHLTLMPQAPSERAPAAGIPRALDELVLRMLAKRKADRPADAAELQQRLHAIAEAPATVAESTAKASVAAIVATPSRGAITPRRVLLALTSLAILAALLWRFAR